MAYEQPRYEVTKRFHCFELRDYAPFVVAETEVEASHAEAGNQGFRRLAGHIFGKNKGARKIAMTAPVAEARATRIAMTAPVWARYDPPFKPWFLRRNEILIEVRT